MPQALAMILLAAASWQLLWRLRQRLWLLVAQAPKQLYQGALLIGCVAGLAHACVHHRFYLGVFYAFVLGLATSWTLAGAPPAANAWQRAFGALLLNGRPPAQFWLALAALVTCSALTLAFHSPAFGGLTAVSYSAMTSFVTVYRPRLGNYYTVTHGITESAFDRTIHGHLGLVAACTALRAARAMPGSGQQFWRGMELYCTAVACIALLVAASPTVKKLNAGRPQQRLRWPKYTRMAAFWIILLAALAVRRLADLQTVASVCCLFGVLMALEWVLVLAHTRGCGRIALLVVLGAVLYGGVALFEHTGMRIWLARQLGDGVSGAGIALFEG